MLVGTLSARLDVSYNLLSGSVPSGLLAVLPSSSQVLIAQPRSTGFNSLSTITWRELCCDVQAWAFNCISGAARYQGCTLMEWPALVELFVSTNLPSAGGWKNTSGWGTLSHPCVWFGVGCSAGNTAVM